MDIGVIIIIIRTGRAGDGGGGSYSVITTMRIRLRCSVATTTNTVIIVDGTCKRRAVAFLIVYILLILVLPRVYYRVVSILVKHLRWQRSQLPVKHKRLGALRGKQASKTGIGDAITVLPNFQHILQFQVVVVNLVRVNDA